MFQNMIFTEQYIYVLNLSTHDEDLESIWNCFRNESVVNQAYVKQITKIEKIFSRFDKKRKKNHKES